MGYFSDKGCCLGASPGRLTLCSAARLDGVHKLFRAPRWWRSPSSTPPCSEEIHDTVINRQPYTDKNANYVCFWWAVLNPQRFGYHAFPLRSCSDVTRGHRSDSESQNRCRCGVSVCVCGVHNPRVSADLMCLCILLIAETRPGISSLSEHRLHLWGAPSQTDPSRSLNPTSQNRSGQLFFHSFISLFFPFDKKQKQFSWIPKISGYFN